MKKLILFGLPLILLAIGLVLGCSSSTDEAYDDWWREGTVNGETYRVTISTDRKVPKVVLTPMSGDRYVITKEGESISSGTVSVSGGTFTFNQAVPEAATFSANLADNRLTFNDGPLASFNQTGGSGGVGAGGPSTPSQPGGTTTGNTGDMRTGLITFRVRLPNSTESGVSGVSGTPTGGVAGTVNGTNTAHITNQLLIIFSAPVELQPSDIIITPDNGNAKLAVPFSVTPYPATTFANGGIADDAGTAIIDKSRWFVSITDVERGRIWVAIQKPGVVALDKKLVGVFDDVGVSAISSITTYDIAAAAAAAPFEDISDRLILTLAAATPSLTLDDIKVISTQNIRFMAGSDTTGTGINLDIASARKKVDGVEKANFYPEEIYVYVDKKDLVDSTVWPIYLTTDEKISYTVQQYGGIEDVKASEGLVFTFSHDVAYMVENGIPFDDTTKFVVANLVLAPGATAATGFAPFPTVPRFVEVNPAKPRERKLRFAPYNPSTLANIPLTRVVQGNVTFKFDADFDPNKINNNETGVNTGLFTAVFNIPVYQESLAKIEKVELEETGLVNGVYSRRTKGLIITFDKPVGKPVLTADTAATTGVALEAAEIVFQEHDLNNATGAKHDTTVTANFTPESLVAYGPADPKGGYKSWLFTFKRDPADAANAATEGRPTKSGEIRIRIDPTLGTGPNGAQERHPLFINTEWSKPFEVRGVTGS
ncbi:MAG: hypothetical protein LBH43_16995 [Treponema sp.]|jgi:hypothetical protein|nr:hypothetical protein [Treponema sp.]